MKDTTHSWTANDKTANQYITLQKVNNRLPENSKFNNYTEYIQFIEKNLKKYKQKAISNSLQYYIARKKELEKQEKISKLDLILMNYYKRQIDYVNM